MPPALWPGASTFPGSTTFPGQPQTVWHVLWASFDDVGTPFHDRVWTDLSSRLRSWHIEGGRDSELEEVDATNALYVLDDRDRELDPTNAASTFAPDVVPNRLIWHRIHADGLSSTVFLGYVDGWEPSWETGSPDNRAHIRCTDGRKILTAWSLDAANPDVVEWDEVPEASDPSFSYPMTEPQGTKLVGHRRIIKFKKGKKKGKWKRTKRWKTRETRADVTGVSGPSGTYKNTPLLGQPGPIAGDPGTAVRFRSSLSEHATIPVDVDDFRGLTALTVAAWVKPTLTGSAQHLVEGPENATAGADIFGLRILASGAYSFGVLDNGEVERTASSSTIFGAVNVWRYVVGTWDGTNVRLYVDGVLQATTACASILNGTAGVVTIAGPLFADATIGRVRIYEKVLTQPQIQAHFDAAALGFGSMTTGTRIGSVLDLVGEFGEWNVSAGTRTMPPARYAGLEPAQLIDEAEDGEGLPALFHFSRAGIPTFRDAAHRASPPFDTALFTFGTGAGELPILEATVSDQDAYHYNIIRATREGGDQTFTATDAVSVGRYGRLALPVEDLPIGDDADAQAYADALLARYKDPTIRIERFSVAGTDAARREAILTLDLQDCVEVNVLVPKGAEAAETYTQTSHIERRRLWQESGEPIRAEYAISPR